MINRFRREMPAPLVGFGHSMGGCQLVHLAHLHPRLFTTLLLVDPVIRPRPSSTGRNMMVAYPSTFKEDSWPNLEAAQTSLRKNPFYKGWDARVLDRFIDHGLRYIKQGEEPVTLTTSKHQEVFSVARPAYPPDQRLTDFAPTRVSHPDYLPNGTDNVYKPPVPFYRPEPTIVFSHLASLRPHVLYISPTSSPVADPAARAEVVGITGTGQGGNGGLEGGAVREIVIPKSDHFVPFVRPHQVAELAAKWLGNQMQRWREEVKEWERWAALPHEQKITVDEQWKFWMKRLYGKKSERTVRLKSKM